jgi:hypothetical protein
LSETNDSVEVGITNCWIWSTDAKP